MKRIFGKRYIFSDRDTKRKKSLFKFALFMTFLLFGTGLGVLKLSNLEVITVGLETIYADRIMPLHQLKAISDMYGIHIVDTAHKVMNGNIPWSEGQRRLEKTMKIISYRWNAYNLTYLVDGEKRLITELIPLFQRADATAKKLEYILRNQDPEALENLVKRDLYQSIDPVTKKIDGLFVMQINIAKSICDGEKVRSRYSRLIGMISIAVGFVLSLVLAIQWRSMNRFSL